MSRRKVAEQVIVECETFLSPLLDHMDVLSDAVATHQDVAAWLPRAKVTWLFSSEHTLSTYGKWIRSRMEEEGLHVSTRGSVVAASEHTRMLWLVRTESDTQPDGRYEVDLYADRRRTFVVETGRMFAWRKITDEVAAYKALMAFPS